MSLTNLWICNHLSAHNHVIKLRGQIEELAQSTEPDLYLIREMIGKCIYTIQAFYSGTNWVEINGDSVYKDFGKI